MVDKWDDLPVDDLPVDDLPVDDHAPVEAERPVDNCDVRADRMGADRPGGGRNRGCMCGASFSSWSRSCARRLAMSDSRCAVHSSCVFLVWLNSRLASSWNEILPSSLASYSLNMRCNSDSAMMNPILPSWYLNAAGVMPSDGLPNRRYASLYCAAGSRARWSTRSAMASSTCEIVMGATRFSDAGSASGTGSYPSIFFRSCVASSSASLSDTTQTEEEEEEEGVCVGVCY